MFLLSLFVFFTPLMAPSLYADTTVDSIPYTTRGSGWFQDNREVKPSHTGTVNLLKQKLSTVTKVDSQYRVTRHYRGVHLGDLVTKLEKGPHVDTVILQFRNGMVVPIGLDKFHENKDSLFLATHIKNSHGKWQRAFPRLRKANPLLNDPRPLTFSGNKIVVSDAQNWLYPETQLNPFRYADSLVGLEFVNYKAYVKQFEVGEHLGQRIFLGRCQFCHSTRGIGGDYGWDFVKPLPTYKQKQPENLLYHVRYTKNHALEAGLMMPSQKDFKKGEADALWKWLKASARKKQKPYLPN